MSYADSMNKLLRRFALLTLGGACACAGANSRPALHILTEHSPPASMLERGRVVGYTTDKIREIMARAGIDHKIEQLPWKRAYLLAQTRADTCVYSVTRTPEREGAFKWIGPTHESDWTLYGRAGREYKVRTLEDARKYRIGAYFGDVRGETLSAQGFDVDPARERIANPRKLLIDRIDLWVSSVGVGGALIADNGWTGQIVPVLTFRKTELYLACNRSVPDALVERMNAALRAMNGEGVSAAIERKYNVKKRISKNE
jgi:polar amino acid transport system substrate-binding protein